MIVRIARPSEARAIYEMGRSAPEFNVGTGSSFWSEEQIARWIENPVDCTLVATSKSDIAGFLLAQYHIPTRKGTIENLYVRPGHRRSGIAKELLARCERDLKRRGCTYLCGLVQTENSASWRTLTDAGFSTGHLFHWMGKAL